MGRLCRATLCAWVVMVCACHSSATKVIVRALPVSHWKTAARHLPQRLLQANLDFSLASKAAIQEGLALPRPGTIKLSDLSPSLRELEGKPDADFLLHARDDRGAPVDFSYAQFDDPRLDALLREAARAKALSYQTHQTLEQMVKLCTAILHEEIGRTPTLYRAVERAAARRGLSAKQREQVHALQKLGRALGVLVPSYAIASRDLVQAGQKLVTDVPSLLNVQLLTHLPTVTASLRSAVRSIEAAGSWTADVAIVLRGFARGATRRNAGDADLDEDRLDRQELAEMLFEP